MADIKGEAPLARLENDDEFGEFADFRSHEDVQNCNTIGNSYFTEIFDDNASIDGSGDSVFGDTISGSLEDLVSTFDEKITKCFSNFQEDVENIAPVQVRSQEEIMEESQMWWTITGNFGNILPIDWSKSHARRLHMPTLNLQGHRSVQLNGGAVVAGQGNDRSGVEEEEDAVASDLDMHALILTEDASVAAEPLKTADQIIQEIDEMLAESDAGSCADLDSPDSAICEVRERPPLASREKLETMSSAELNETLLDLESMVKDYSEVLIDELALRDELEYEKELKNQFISLLLTVQNKRRQSGSDKKKRKTGQTLEAKYLTTVIPYMANSGCPHNSTLQVLIKILRAIDEDSPTVPTLLTDYILKVLCPT